jgi:hypothetical protein
MPSAQVRSAIRPKVLAAAGARAQHLATTDSGGAGAETVTAGTHEAAGLESALHR